MKPVRLLTTCAALLALQACGDGPPAGPDAGHPGGSGDPGAWAEVPDPPPPDAPPWAVEVVRSPYTAADGLIELYFTRPGTTRPDGADPGEDPEVDDALFELMSNAQHSVVACLFEFDRERLIDGLVNARVNDVPVRFVGDADEQHDAGYERLVDLEVVMSLRDPGDRIMHNKFLIVDERWVVTGSMNFSENGVMRNNNNVVIIDSPALAADYLSEFDQMFDLRLFGRQKVPLPKAPVQVGGRPVEVLFSPRDEPVNKVMELLAGADESVYFMVFSFTHELVRERLIELHQQGVEVVGVFDESQARSRYSADDPMAEAGVPVYIDGNENSSGFSGGKLHHKVMIIDAGTDDPVVITGSFNWSENANEYNDENLVILRGPDLTSPFIEEWCRVQEVAVPHPSFTGATPDPCASLLSQIRINELMPNPDGPDADGEYVELVNTGSTSVALGGWTLGDKLSDRRHVFADDLILPPATSLVVWSADPEQVGRIVASSGQLSLTNTAEEVILRDADGTVVDAIAYSNAPSGVSFNRLVDGAEHPELGLHTDVAPDGAPASPGRMADGTLWPGEQARKDLIINELLPNPAGPDTDQEYVEILNVGPEPCELAGFRLRDGLAGAPDRHVFAPGTVLLPGEAVVVFDGGDHSAIPNAVIASTGQLSLNNSGDTVTLMDAGGYVLDQVTWGTAPDGASLNRAEDGVKGTDLVVHGDVVGAVGASSPGTRADGTLWAFGALPLVVINEVLPDPAGSDLGQEYVELVNIGSAAASMGGWRVGDAVSPDRHVFEAGFTLPPGGVVVVFDRGDDHEGVPGMVLSSSQTLSLNNTGDAIYLYDGSGQVVDAVVYHDSVEGVSKNRATDGGADPQLVDHDQLEGAAGPTSPGLRATGLGW